MDTERPGFVARRAHDTAVAGAADDHGPASKKQDGNLSLGLLLQNGIAPTETYSASPHGPRLTIGSANTMSGQCQR